MRYLIIIVAAALGAGLVVLVLALFGVVAGPLSGAIAGAVGGVVGSVLTRRTKGAPGGRVELEKRKW